MKVTFTIIGICACLNLFAQPAHDSTTVVYSWKLLNFYSTLSEINVDTSLTNFQIEDLLYKKSISNSYLGNIGSPGISNVFYQRVNKDDPFYIDPYKAYLFTGLNTEYFNTRKPYSYLKYFWGDKEHYRQEGFDAFFTQNINSKLNLGFQYHNNNSKGQYKFLTAKQNSFRLFSSYTSPRYIMHSTVNLNRYRNAESGGLLNDSVFSLGKKPKGTGYQFTDEIPTAFNGAGDISNAQNSLRYFDVLISNRLKLFTLSSQADTLQPQKKRSIAEPILTYVFGYSRSSKSYTDKDPIKPQYYDAIHFNQHHTYDSVSKFKISNTIQLEFKTTIRGKVQTGVYGLIGSDYEVYNIYSEWDTLENSKNDTSYLPIYIDSVTIMEGVNKSNAIRNSTYFSAGIYGNFWKKVSARFSWTTFFIGQKAGQTSLDGVLDSKLKLLGTNFNWLIEGSINNKVPDYLLNTFYSNNYYWEQNLASEQNLRLSSRIRSSSNTFDIGGNYQLLRNHIYYASDSKPTNYTDPLSYISVDASKTIKVWKIVFFNQLIYQYSENQNILPLPGFILHNATYFDHIFKFKQTGGELSTMLGVDIYYNTKFKGYSYSPALAQFHVQDQETIGNYPLMDAFLNIQLKRTRFFFKLQHFSSTLFGQDYYSVVHYPHQQLAFKFGMSWTFYD